MPFPLTLEPVEGQGLSDSLQLGMWGWQGSGLVGGGWKPARGTYEERGQG